MVKTIASIFITLGIIFGVSFYESKHVKNTFTLFENALLALYDKTESGDATIEDGEAIETLWEAKKKTLHIWIPHTAIQEVDYQLYEAVGYIYVRDYKSALPKIEVLLGMCENVPHYYTFSIENIF